MSKLSNQSWMVLAVGLIAVLVLVGVATLPALRHQGPPGGPGAGGPGRPGGGPMGPGPRMGGPKGPPPPPPSPPTTMLAADGVLYVACDGKLTAFEAKTLKKLTEATYAEPRPHELGRGHAGGGGGKGDTTPPAAGQ